MDNVKRQDKQLKVTIAEKNGVIKEKFFAKSICHMYRKENQKLKNRIVSLEKHVSKRTNSTKANKSEIVNLKQEISELKERIKALRKRNPRSNQSKLLKASQEKILEYELKIIDDKLLIEKLKARLQTKERLRGRKGRSLPNTPRRAKPKFRSPIIHSAQQCRTTAAKLTQEVLELENDNINLKKQIDQIRNKSDIVIPQELKLVAKENEKLVSRNLELEGELNRGTPKRGLNFDQENGETPDSKRQQLVDLEKEVIYLTNIVNSPMKFPRINTDLEEVHEDLSVPDQIRLATKKLESLAEEEKKKQFEINEKSDEISKLRQALQSEKSELEILEFEKSNEIHQLRVQLEAIEENKTELQQTVTTMQNTMNQKEAELRDLNSGSLRERSKDGVWVKKWVSTRKQGLRMLRVDSETSTLIVEGGKKHLKLNLQTLLSVEEGNKEFPKKAQNTVSAATCFTIKFENQTINFQSGCRHERDEWVRLLQSFMVEN